ncbi:hypothetical protein [Flavilitoribacter nigricans]|uniref:Uncharacterized protein n=1 Tax=Flavilitoribacter nigricans (strain ATCC 23147 / DSM 23189 / NBRC 102662 / NCIMB 1420 / SS-2) TaxID=1122177 RepID=A0A2D0N336_FLAN2|nr:hypothetical protein [Flavilitoribacter nigricans]PHN02857.1 hypothetical protein CRP01_30225 [Flavilitoribacter nigricans DSM 23189 = NBRC 102662]
MKAILDLIDLVDLRKLSVIGVNGDKTDELFGLVKAGEIRQTEDGIAHFYAGQESGATGNFNRLKRNLQKRLINTFFSSDFHRDTYLTAYFSSFKKDIVCEALMKSGKSGTAAALAQEALPLAIKFHFPELAASLARKLAHHYSVIAVNRRKYEKFRAIRDQYHECAYWENKAVDYYNDLAIDLRLAKTVKSDLIEKAKKYKSKLDAVAHEVPVLNFHLFRLNIHLFLFKILNNGEGIEKTCREGIDFISRLEFTPPPRAQRTFHFNLIPAYLQTGNFEAAYQTIRQLKQMVEKGSHNWIIINAYQCILGFHWQRDEITGEGITAIYDSKLYRIVEEELRIYETYRAILSDSDAIKLGKFLNETPHYSADKKGMNINILVLQFLVFLRRNDRSAIIDRMEALQAYAYRYLAKDPTTRRSELFFRMLFLLAKSAFDLEEVERRSPGITAELHNTPRQISAIDIEVVPYEILWEKVKTWC